MNAAEVMPRRLKVLFISDVYFPRVNGVSTSIATFRRELRGLGCEVHLIAPDYGRVTEDESGILRVPSSGLPFDPEDRLMRSAWVMRQESRLRQEGYDLIHVQTPFAAHYLGLKLARRLGIPCVETYHTYFAEYFHHYVPFLPKGVSGAIARRVSRSQGNSLQAMVVPSRPMLEVLRDYGITTRMEVLPTGLDAERFMPGDRAAFRQCYDIEQGRPMLLFVGRVAHEKNIGFLLRMLDEVRRAVPEVLLLIAGEGPARPGLEAEVRHLGLQAHVRFLGYLDRQRELSSCYRAADLFVFSSRTETQGLVLLEAMAQSVPVVSIAEMGTRDVLSEGRGVHIAREDAAEFADKVVALLRDRSAREALGRAALEHAQEWSASRMAQRMLAFYGETVSQAASVSSSQPELAPQESR